MKSFNMHAAAGYSRHLCPTPTHAPSSFVDNQDSDFANTGDTKAFAQGETACEKKETQRQRESERESM